MRQVILDPQESDKPDSEQFLGITTASNDEYTALENFMMASGDRFPFTKIDAELRPTPCSNEVLLRFIMATKETFPEEEIPLPTAAGLKYTDDWDSKDYAFEAGDKFVRVVWITTA